MERMKMLNEVYSKIMEAKLRDSDAISEEDRIGKITFVFSIPVYFE